MNDKIAKELLAAANDLIAAEDERLVTAEEMMQYCPACAKAIEAGEMQMTRAELQEQLHQPSIADRVAARWESLPDGWTDESREKFWESLTGDVKHKVTKCMKEMEGKVSDTGAFCASLADRVDPGWRSRSSSKKVAGPYSKGPYTTKDSRRDRTLRQLEEAANEAKATLDFKYDMGLPGAIQQADKALDKALAELREYKKSKYGSSFVAADLYFDPTPDWDKVRFKEPKQWVFSWQDGGWNGVIAKSKKEAIAKARKEWAGTKWDGQWIESSFKVPSHSEYKSLLRMFD